MAGENRQLGGRILVVDTKEWAEAGDNPNLIVTAHISEALGLVREQVLRCIIINDFNGSTVNFGRKIKRPNFKQFHEFAVAIHELDPDLQIFTESTNLDIQRVLSNGKKCLLFDRKILNDTRLFTPINKPTDELSPPSEGEESTTV